MLNDYVLDSPSPAVRHGTRKSKSKSLRVLEVVHHAALAQLHVKVAPVNKRSHS